MTKLRILIALCCVTLPSAALAQGYGGEPLFNGLKLGASLDYRKLNGDYRLPGLSADLDESRRGFAYRGYLGFDTSFGGAVVVGAEAGLGRGGKALKTSNAVGDYALQPTWSWDASARLGVTPMPNMLIYGRAGRSWLRVKERTEFVAARPDIRDRRTEAGFLYGFGLETALAPNLFLRSEYARANYNDGFTSSKVQVGVSMGF